MAQYSLYKNCNKTSKSTYPFFVDVQSDLLDGLNSRVVIPLSSHKNINSTNVDKLCPVLNMEGETYILLTHQMTSVPASLLKEKVGTLENYRYEILGAIDLLMTGI